MGRSTGPGSLALWTHHLKAKTFIPRYRGYGYTGPAIRMGAGVQVREAYEFAHDAGQLVVGGECQTVGIAGGYTPGGGHSTLSSLVGMAADQTLEFEVFLANGTFLTVSPSQHPDLYWALSGGGPSTYALVWSITVKSHADVPVAGLVLTMSSDNHTAFWEFVDYYHSLTPIITAHGAYSFARYQTGSFQIHPLFAANLTQAVVQSAFADPLVAKLKALGITAYTNETSTYPDFLTAYDALFDEFAAGKTLYGGRLIAYDTVTKDPAGLSRAVRSISDRNGTIVEVAMRPTLQIAANVSDNAVLPAWRDTLLHVLTILPWNDTASFSEMVALENEITSLDRVLKKLVPGSGAYMNEADFNNPDWKKDFFGVNYERLLRVKEDVDPSGVFYAPTTVGSDRWVEDATGRLCPV